MSTSLAEATASLERRIAEIDRLLAETDGLRVEREHLARALEEVAAATSAGSVATRAAPTGTGRGRRTTNSASHARRRTTGRKRPRAPQGANRERIVAFLRDNGASGATNIAKGTGINRAVVYNNLGKMTADGTVIVSDADGARHFRLASA
jgi:hypothetical protein